jgi:hypothetical protein
MDFDLTHFKGGFMNMLSDLLLYVLPSMFLPLILAGTWLWLGREPNQVRYHFYDNSYSEDPLLGIEVLKDKQVYAGLKTEMQKNEKSKKTAPKKAS